MQVIQICINDNILWSRGENVNSARPFSSDTKNLFSLSLSFAQRSSPSVWQRDKFQACRAFSKEVQSDAFREDLENN